MSYIGRFAPSPSGPLHLGSLVAALGSYFQAKSNNGKWLLRIEDLDPPREVPGAVDQILRALEAYHLPWDGEVVYQSQRHPIYQGQIDLWLESGQAYYCQCTRKQIKASGGYYLGTCRDKHIANTSDCSVRLHVEHDIRFFNDLKHGQIDIPDALAKEDFIIKRRDGLFAYNLAVVLDDIEQGITEVVRGADLIEPTGRQISLYRTLNTPEVSYLHLPLVVDGHGNKLSKQNRARAIDMIEPKVDLINAMQLLGFSLDNEMRDGSVEELIQWGCENWSLKQLPASIEVTS
ncbi:tRNA glutamyl-Q(34) synthetase GluQRS [Vibrio sp. S4M6]|uniref:tRNA glutamyl-Q(34) synthetase GluQRS n=1 Tax=Vibrio sinus TaxID=2946865 RepID=UPI00202A24DE|nr:tRNA glutamyl-Q(34) synthetase GluQRS [Vibrio sinus]MCL9781060.1 tRNA glutamyl-Q(34) synthetase GluQRS [Vibrio sinus]